MKNKKNYNSNSNSDSPILVKSGGRLKYYFLNLLILFALPYLLSKFYFNPILISVLICFLLLVVLPINYTEYIYVEKDKLVILYKKVFFLQFLNVKRTFYYNEIEKILVTLKHDKRTDITSFIIDLTSKIKLMPSNTLEIKMKNGKNKHISSEIYKEEIHQIIHFMRERGVEINIYYPDKKLL